MNDLQIFQSADFGSIRTMEQDDKVLFCGRDVAAALGYTNTKDALSKHCKGVAFRYPLETAGGTQEARFITEGDVYRLITHSRLPAAEQFERWVFDDVLPTIRRTGGYTMPKQHAQQIAALQSLQADLKRWRELEEGFADAARARARSAQAKAPLSRRGRRRTGHDRRGRSAEGGSSSAHELHARGGQSCRQLAHVRLRIRPK